MPRIELEHELRMENIYIKAYACMYLEEHSQPGKKHNDKYVCTLHKLKEL